jgi:hypothetical protein
MRFRCIQFVSPTEVDKFVAFEVPCSLQVLGQFVLVEEGDGIVGCSCLAERRFCFFCFF